MLSARILIIFTVFCANHASRLKVRHKSKQRPQRQNVLLGHYELSAKLGSGAYGEIWRARDTATGHDVAIKLFTNANVTAEALAAESLGCTVQLMLRQKAKAMSIDASRFNDCLADCLGQDRVEALRPWWADTTHCGDGERPFLVLELLESMVELCDADKMVSSEKNSLIASQVLEGVMVMGTSGVRLHGAGFYPAVSHSDMHGKNIMVRTSRKRPRGQEAPRIITTIIDFGEVKVFSGSPLKGGTFFPNENLLAGDQYPDFPEEVAKVMFAEKVIDAKKGWIEYVSVSDVYQVTAGFNCMPPKAWLQLEQFKALSPPDLPAAYTLLHDSKYTL